jgi:hypothetical protein
MGGGISKTNPNKHSVIINEIDDYKNIISLSKVLLAINYKTKDNIKLLVINQLKNEIPLALNFIMSTIHHDDLYNTLSDTEYSIVNISSWHKHEYCFSVYIKLLNNSKNISKINQCKCLLTDTQLQYYNFIINFFNEY